LEWPVLTLNGAFGVEGSDARSDYRCLNCQVAEGGHFIELSAVREVARLGG
jgi:hypothetical protein